jgi:hypothetical protein
MHRHRPHARASVALSLALLPLLAACAEGGGEDRPRGEVRIAASHHFFALTGERRFDFPVNPAEVGSDRGILKLLDDSTYTIQRGNQESGAADYALSRPGDLSLTVPISARQNTRYTGAYGLAGNTGVVHFVDRFSPSATSQVGLFFGVPVAGGAPNLAGDWHAFTQHVVFSASPVQDPRNVGRAAAGTLTVVAANTFTGTLAESSRANLAANGALRPFNDGRVDVDLAVREGSGPPDNRVFLGAAAGTLLLAVDADDTDGEAGLLAMVRKRTGRADLTLLAGTYLIGLETVFVNPGNCGLDAAVGTLTISANGDFRLEAVGSNAADFTYTGTMRLADDGALTITVPATNETWAGAIDQEYRSIVVVDHFVEQRSGSKPPELNLLLGVRQADA